MLRSALLKKSLALIAVLMALLLGLRVIDSVSRDRVAQRAYAVQSVQQSAAGPQVVAGPVISRWCVEESTVSKVVDGKTVVERKREQRVLRVFPTTLDWRGEIKVEPRRRSLCTVNTYRAALVGLQNSLTCKHWQRPSLMRRQKLLVPNRASMCCSAIKAAFNRRR